MNEVRRICIGIPRVLNMFDNYLFWKTLFVNCGFETVLSPESTVELFQKGAGSIMSENICFPAKLVHGHIVVLLEKGVDRLFYPLVPKAEQEFTHASNSYNCPVVSGYPDVIRSAIDPEGRFGTPFDTPVIGFNNRSTLKSGCRKYFKSLGVRVATFDRAFDEACRVSENAKTDDIMLQRQILDEAIRKGSLIFIVAGRPYHSDPLIHQKTGQILSDLGVDVLSDDVFRACSDEGGYGKLNFVSQWSYPNRVVQAALQVAKLPRCVQMIQLNSFGCGPDSFLSDEASSILKCAGKNLTVVRIDEIASPGSVRLRLRSLVESFKSLSEGNQDKTRPYEGYGVSFEKKDRTKLILIPWFADFLSPFIPGIGKRAGYRFENLPQSDSLSAEIGLKYGHNEVCYPSTLVLGDLIKALQSGRYDVDDVAVAITQTGGQCRATNYISQIKMGLMRAGFGRVPVIAVASGKTFQSEQSGFRVPQKRLANITIYAVLYGDALYRMYNVLAVREVEKGAAKRLFDKFMELGREAIEMNRPKDLLSLLKQAVDGFNELAVRDGDFVKVRLVGEIFVKYNDHAQAHIASWLRERGMEVVIPPLIDFIMQYFVNVRVNDEYGIEKMPTAERLMQGIYWTYLNSRILRVEQVMKGFRYFVENESIFAKARHAREVLHLSNQFGEGWLIAAEIAGFSRHGVNKVVCLQPFGCIANHVVAKGIEKRLKQLYPTVDLLYLDIDSGVAEVNLQNRLSLMLD
jgi:predicted nucleotide-binding protein (sugar kinase/HSP70/actin superfamily)